MKKQFHLVLTFVGLIVAASQSHAGLLAHYTFENAANRGEDISGNGNDAVPGGGTHATTYVTATVAGVETTVLNTAGSSTGWAMPNTTVAASSSAYSVAGWMNSTDTNGYLFGQRDNDGTPDRIIITPASSNGVVYNGVGPWYSGAKTWTDRQTDFLDGEWHHFAFVVDGTAVSIYLDGTLWDSLTMNEAGNSLNPVSGNYRHRFGTDGDGAAELTGSFDDLRLYDHALSAAEVEALVPNDDTDDDGLVDTWEDLHFGDGDGIPTPTELGYQAGGDDGYPTPDGDGLDNTAEQANGTDPNVADTDEDGLNDGQEVGGALNPFSGAPTDPADADSDDDGINDGDEVNGTLNAANSNEATDPNSADTDGDFMTDLYEVTNNLLDGLNPNDVSDGAIGQDLDGDGLDNIGEHGGTPQTRADIADTDSDGYDDAAEDLFGSWDSVTATGTDPTNPDSDGDGLLDGEENPDLPAHNPPTQYKTDPNIFDTDGDFYGDGDEITAGTDPDDDADVPTGIPVRNVDFSGATGGWTSAGGVTLDTSTELLSGSGQYALIEGAGSGNGVILEYPNPTVPTVMHNVANCSVDFRIDGTLGGTGGLGINSGANNGIRSDGTVHCILRVLADGSVGAYDGVALQEVVAAGGIVAGTTYTAELDHNITAETYDVRIIETATSTPVGSLGGVPTRPTSDPAADPLYFTAGMQNAASGWDVAIDNMSVSFSTVTPPAGLAITSAGFNGPAFEMTVTGFDTSKMYLLKRSTDLQAFSDIGTAFTPAATTEVVSDPSPTGTEAYYRVEKVTP